MPMDFIAFSLPVGMTGSKSRPFACALSISPPMPSQEWTSFLSAFASSPIVIIPRLFSFSFVRAPTKRSSSTGRIQTFSRKFSCVITVVASGFFISEPSFAKVLLKLTPTDAVSPSCLRYFSRISPAISSPAFALGAYGLISIHASSMPNGSTLSLYVFSISLLSSMASSYFS